MRLWEVVRFNLVAVYSLQTDKNLCVCMCACVCVCAADSCSLQAAMTQQ